jgi:hypothetical protein
MSPPAAGDFYLSQAADVLIEIFIQCRLQNDDRLLEFYSFHRRY